MLKNAPPAGSLHCDDMSGRYRITYALFAPQSVSWSKRGMRRAAVEHLQIWWEYHTRITGEVCPIDLNHDLAA